MREYNPDNYTDDEAVSGSEIGDHFVNLINRKADAIERLDAVRTVGVVVAELESKPPYKEAMSKIREAVESMGLSLERADIAEYSALMGLVLSRESDSQYTYHPDTASSDESSVAGVVSITDALIRSMGLSQDNAQLASDSVLMGITYLQEAEAHSRIDSYPTEWSFQ
jgi:hypothetical protein